MKLPRWAAYCLCAVTGASVAMAAVAFRSPDGAKEPTALAYLLYAFVAAFVVVAGYDREVDGAADSKVEASLALFVLATAGGVASFWFQAVWLWAIAMMVGIAVFLVPRRSRAF